MPTNDSQTMARPRAALRPALILLGALSGFFIVPMNAILQHRGATLLSAGAARLRPDATITALGAGAQYRAAGVGRPHSDLRHHRQHHHKKHHKVVKRHHRIVKHR